MISALLNESDLRKMPGRKLPHDDLIQNAYRLCLCLYLMTSQEDYDMPQNYDDLTGCVWQLLWSARLFDGMLLPLHSVSHQCSSQRNCLMACTRCFTNVAAHRVFDDMQNISAQRWLLDLMNSSWSPAAHEIVHKCATSSDDILHYHAILMTNRWII